MFPSSQSYDLQEMYFIFSFSICKNVPCYNKGHVCVLNAKEPSSFSFKL